MIIMGVDPGTAATGIGIVDYRDRKPFLISYRLVRTNSKKPLPFRLREIYQAVKEEIDKHKPDYVVVEEVFGGKNIQSTLKIGQARGAAIIAAVNANIEVREYSPAEIKMSVVGRGAAAKEQVQYMVKNILGLKEEAIPHDCADALAAALCHANRLNFQEKQIR
ncbi:crossover junction endodeoxyribonuclease RuvC [bacterium]|nr:crossover junction endodeoxyribonuclease RuvC [bacterium]